MVRFLDEGAYMQTRKYIIVHCIFAIGCCLFL